FVHSGEFVQFRKRRYGASSAGIPGDRFVIFNMNHDQVGNRPLGERLSMLVDFDRLKVAAAAMFFAPYIPMLFMGEEYGDRSPFFYFVSHSDKALIEAVHKGRREEFKNFRDEGDPADAQDINTFERSRIKWAAREKGEHAMLLLWHRELILQRRTIPALQNFRKDDIRVHLVNESCMMILRQCSNGTGNTICLLNFDDRPIECSIPFQPRSWQKVLDSKDPRWAGRLDDQVMPEIIQGHDPFILAGLAAVIYKAL
ncbi:MAG TPA: DUF3459 domain-containing protein, partial [Chryseosolibacter sp.]|nr:DUF3459 domain-containing protein [Chryseosolibacter sp.]